MKKNTALYNIELRYGIPNNWWLLIIIPNMFLYLCIENIFVIILTLGGSCLYGLRRTKKNTKWSKNIIKTKFFKIYILALTLLCTLAFLKAFCL